MGKITDVGYAKRLSDWAALAGSVADSAISLAQSLGDAPSMDDMDTLSYLTIANWALSQAAKVEPAEVDDSLPEIATVLSELNEWWENLEFGPPVN